VVAAADPGGAVLPADRVHQRVILQAGRAR